MDVLSEKVIEDLIEAYSEELLGEPLELVERQMTLGTMRPDLLFRDQQGRDLVVEVKRGELTRKALGQVGEYLGMFKSKWPDRDFRFMLVGTSIPAERKIYFELIGCEVRVLEVDWLRKFAEAKGIDLVVGIPRLEPKRVLPANRSPRFSLDLLGVTDENSFLSNLSSQPNTAAVERVTAIYALLNSFSNTEVRFKEQGRAIFSLSSVTTKVDVAYVGLNRKYRTDGVGDYGYECVVLWRNIASHWPDQLTFPLKDVLISIKPDKRKSIQGESPKEGVYVGINLALDVTEEQFQMLLTGLRDFIVSTTLKLHR